MFILLFLSYFLFIKCTSIPTKIPTQLPSKIPTMEPTNKPTTPTIEPTLKPTYKPSTIPTYKPTTLPSLDSNLCPNGWIGWGYKCYIVSTYTMPQPDAILYCGSINGELVTIDGPEEHYYLYQMYSKLYEVWIGLIRFSSTSFVWISDPTKTPATYLPWQKPNEPVSSQKYVSMGYYSSNRSAWATEFDYAWVRALCQLRSKTYQPSPEPTISSFPTLTYYPTSPSFEPTTFSPSNNPTILPTRWPTLQPSAKPTNPTVEPTFKPSFLPSTQPTFKPSVEPSFIPTKIPTSLPSILPTKLPSVQPTLKPTTEPSVQPTKIPTFQPSTLPTRLPSSSPSLIPTNIPTSPTTKPTISPTSPTLIPSLTPSLSPSFIPSVFPTTEPTIFPSYSPTNSPTSYPTTSPTSNPTEFPTLIPSLSPTSFPTSSPSSFPSNIPSHDPTISPTLIPSIIPSLSPTSFPSLSPSSFPSDNPSFNPTILPSPDPTLSPSLLPSFLPTTSSPTLFPTIIPTTSLPTTYPTSFPSSLPSINPSSISLTTSIPSKIPSIKPSYLPSFFPTTLPSYFPTSIPSTIINTPVSLISSIVGSNTRTVRISSSLTFKCDAYILIQNTRLYTGLTYEWNVLKNDTLENMLPQSIMIIISNTMKIPASILQPNTNYLIKVNVKSNEYNLVSSTFTQLSTLPLNSLIIIISGGLNQQLQLGSSLTLSAEQSYDPEGQTKSFTFIWSCLKISPITSSSLCDLNISSFNSKYLLKTLSTTNIGNIYSISLTITDGKRQTTQSIQITITSSTSPIISIINSKVGKVINPSDSLKLYGTLKLSNKVNATWSLSNSNINLQSISTTSIQQTFDSGTKTFNLILLPYTLLGSNIPYLFTLSADNQKATIQILINIPPSYGKFYVSPINGIALSTSFNYFTSGWIDNDLPITYEYGFYSITSTNNNNNNNLINLIQSRSESLTALSSLPTGLSTNNYTISCTLKIYDIYDGFTLTTFIVYVTPPKIDTTSKLQLEISNQLKQNQGSVDSLLSISSIAVSILNTKTCLNAPNCTLLNRYSCSQTSDTCGKCLNNFIGISGDSNTYCISQNNLLSAVINNQNTKSCNIDTDCDPWNYCNLNYKTCQIKQKECSSTCINHGKCISYNIQSNNILSATCNLLDSNCNVKCQCNNGYYGEQCEMNIDDLNAAQNIRKDLLSNLENIITLQDLNIETITSQVISISEITSQPLEISYESRIIAQRILNSIVTSIDSLSISSDIATELFSTINSIGLSQQLTTSTSITTRTRRLLSNSSNTNNLIELADSISSNLLNSIIDNQNSINLQNSLISLGIHSLKKSDLINIPIPLINTDDLISSTINPPIVSLHTNTNNNTNNNLDNTENNQLHISITSSDPSLHSNLSSNISSKVVQLNIPDLNSSLSVNTIIINLPLLPTYNSTYIQNSNIKFNITCNQGEIIEKYFTCPGNSFNNLTYKYACNGTAVIIQSSCPNIYTNQTCKVMKGGSKISCTSLYSSINSKVTCSCKKINSDESSSILDQSGVIEVASLTLLVTDDFKTTILTADEFNSVNDLKKTLIVILLYGTLWSIGLIGLCLCSAKYQKHRIDIATNKTGIDEAKEKALLTRSKDSIRQYLTTYVNEAIPSVFRSNSEVFRLWDEIRKHHRFLSLFIQGHENDTQRMITGIHLLTVQSMLMFILAVCYDIQYPKNDGTCEQYLNQHDCLKQTAIIDSSRSLCDWNTDNNNNNDNNEYNDNSSSCVYAPPVMTFKSMLVISLYVSLLTAIINYFVDFLFIGVLSAPTLDNSKRIKNNKEKQNSSFFHIKKNIENNIPLNPLKSAPKHFIINENDKDNDKDNDNDNNNNYHDNSQEMETTLVIPESVQEAHVLALSCSGDLVKNAKQQLSKQSSIFQEKKKVSLELKRKIALDRHRNKLKEKVLRNQNDIPLTKIKQVFENSDNIERITSERFIELTIDINAQRRLLKKNQQEIFDESWGVDPTGEFSQQQTRYYFWYRLNSAAETIKKEIKFALKESKKKYEKLKFANDLHIGMELLHLFIIDLLGRDTPVAKIFIAKTEEDFRHSYVVHIYFKYFAWLCVILMNLFFVYFSMLRGLQRGQDWQILFLFACIIQFCIELLFYETSECLIINYIVPNLARKEVQSVSFVINQIIQSLCYFSSEDTSIIQLNAPSYLFVSTNLAEKFPDLFESILIRSFRSYKPGELSKKWKISHGTTFQPSSMFQTSPENNRRIRRMTVSAILVSYLQYLGALSGSFQRLIIHSLQPLVASAIGLLFSFLYQNPLWYLIFLPFILYGFMLIFNFHKEMSLSVQEEINNIHPIQDSIDENIKNKKESIKIEEVIIQSNNNNNNNEIYSNNDYENENNQYEINEVNEEYKTNDNESNDIENHSLLSSLRNRVNSIHSDYSLKLHERIFHYSTSDDDDDNRNANNKIQWNYSDFDESNDDECEHFSFDPSSLSLSLSHTNEGSQEIYNTSNQDHQNWGSSSEFSSGNYSESDSETYQEIITLKK